MLNRRRFLKSSALGGLAIGSMIENTIAFALPLSGPSELRITDMRYVVVEHLGRPCPILRIDTNQDIYGYGEVRDGGKVETALVLKGLLLGKNPTDVEEIFQTIKPFGGHNRLGGGVSGVEMALWDLAGKAHGAPVWKLLGGRFRDKIRLYADTHGNQDYELIREKVSVRVQDQGYTWLKMTRVFNVLKGLPETLEPDNQQILTPKGIEIVAEYLQMVRDTVGEEVEISADHFVGRNLENMTRQAHALKSVGLAWMEEPINWKQTLQLKALREAVDTPIATGENMFALESFQQLIDHQAVDIVHPDMATAGGILETKKIGDYAQMHDIGMALHYAGTPVSFMANVHCAAATENCKVLEYHPEGDEIPEWTGMVHTTGGQPLISQGYAPVPDSPGLGVELNMDHIETLLHSKDRSVFADTSAWDHRQGK